MLKEIHHKIFEENKKLTGIVGMIALLITIAAVFSYETSAVETEDARDVLDKLRVQAGEELGPEVKITSESKTFSGSTNENGETEEQFTIDEITLFEVNAVLTWTDEPGGIGPFGIAQINNPDEFQVTLESPSGERQSSGFQKNTAGGSMSGTAMTKIMIEPGVDETGDWKVIVEAGDCGDTTGQGGLITTEADNGNDWDLTVTYSFFEVEE